MAREWDHQAVGSTPVTLFDSAVDGEGVLTVSFVVDGAGDAKFHAEGFQTTGAYGRVASGKTVTFEKSSEGGTNPGASIRKILVQRADSTDTTVSGLVTKVR